MNVPIKMNMLNVYLVIVMVKKIDSEYAKAAAYLERGQAFGVRNANS